MSRYKFYLLYKITEKQYTINATENLKLIECSFPADEAGEILFGIFYSKINFLKIENLSLHQGFGKDDEIAKKNF